MNSNKYTNIWIGINSDKIKFQNLNNLFIGNTNLYKTSIISGTNNIYIGNKTNSFSYSGNYNIFIGEESGNSGLYNVVLGYNSGNKLHLKSYNNILLGKQTAFNLLTGYNNIMLGYQAGYSNQNSNNNIFIGYQAGYYERSSNKLYIANNNSLNPLIYGDFENNYIRINSVLALYPTTNPFAIAGGLSFDGTSFKGYDGSVWIEFGSKYLSCGVYGTCPAIVNNLDGTITLPSCEATLFPSDNFTGSISKYTIPSATLALTDLVTNYVIINYNNGNPEYQITLDVDDINESDIVPVYTIYKSGNDLHDLNWDRLGSGLSNKLHHRIVKTQRFARETGLILSEDTGRKVLISDGRVFMGAVKVILNDFDSFAVNNQWCFWYHVAGVWTVAQENGIGYRNTHYDDGTNLVEMTNNNRYTILWIFRGIENHEHGAYILHNYQYTSLALAREVVTLPPLPQFIATHMLLVGRIIIQKNAASGFIESSFTTQFIGAPINIHNELANIQGGDVVLNEFYHLSKEKYYNNETPINGTITRTGDLISQVTLNYSAVPTKTIDINYDIDDKITTIVKTQDGYVKTTTLIYDIDGNITGFTIS